MKVRFVTFALTTAVILSCCPSCNKQYKMGTYAYDRAFLSKHGIETLELIGNNGQARVLLSPALQGRVMTSTTEGESGMSYGWINQRFLEAGEVSPQFNPYGGEERFWIGPEGGPFSWYFKEGQEQVYENWLVPAVIDTEPFELASQSETEAVFVKDFSIGNASGNQFSIGVKRAIILEDKAQIEDLLGVGLPDGIKVLGYRTENTLTNRGDNAWDKQTGMPSVWLLGTFNPTPTTTVFIPYYKDYDGPAVNDMYFGKVPENRLILKDGIAYFKIDGEYRSKIGLPAGSAKDICGSYDAAQGVLNILKYTVPGGDVDYVNGQWGPQENTFGGDVINSYNDGPTETGLVMGPFYEIETSSPGAALSPGESLTHIQHTIHLRGPEGLLAPIAKSVFGVDLETVAGIFKK